MSNELQKEMMPVVKGVRTGQIPIKTAREASRAGYVVVMDKNAECRKSELGLDDEYHQQSIAAMEKACPIKDDES